MKILALPLLALALLLPGATARAGEVAHWDLPPAASASAAQGTDFVGPVLAADRVVWGRGSNSGAWTVAAATPGAPMAAPTTLVTLPLVGAPGGQGDYHALRLFGSPTRLALFDGIEAVDDGKYQQSHPVRTRILAGPVGGPFAALLDCGPSGAPECPQACLPSGFYGGSLIALAGDALLYDDPCTPDPAPAAATAPPGALQRTDLAAAPPATTTLPIHLRQTGVLAIAGELAAVNHPDGSLSAIRLADASEVGAYPPPAATPGGQTQLLGTGMQPDGKLVGVRQTYVPPRTEVERVQWRAPGDPAVHELPLALVSSQTQAFDGGPYVAIAGDRILARTRAADGAEQYVVSDLAGHATPLVRFGPDRATRPAARPLGFAFDGTRLAWAAIQCERVTVGLARVGDAPATVAHAVCARPRVVSKSARLDRAGRFRVGITCREGCRGKLYVRLLRGGLATARFGLKPSLAVRHVGLRLKAAARRRKGPLAAVADIDHDPDYGVGTPLVLRR